MSIEKNMLERYLDGELTAAERAAVEAAAAADISTAAALRDLRAQRAARALVFASYEPAAHEARAYADAVMAAAYSPVGKIGVGRWVRRISAIAAAAAIVVGAFAIGRVTAPSSSTVATTGSNSGSPASIVQADTHLADHPYMVVYWNPLGELQVRQFANAPDVDAFVTDLQARSGPGAVAYTSDDTGGMPGSDDSGNLTESGSF